MTWVETVSVMASPADLLVEFYHPGVPYSLCLPPPTSHPLPPPADLDRRPIPLTVLGGGVVFFFPPSPVHPPRPPCAPRRLLVSSKFWFLGCPFVRILEAWAPPLPGDFLAKPLPPRYSAMPVPFRLPKYPPTPYPLSLPPCRHDLILVARRSVGLITRSWSNLRM